MDTKEIKEKLKIDDIINLMEYFGADVGTMTEEYITFTSICHGSSSHKFYYYPRTKSFYCFVCGNIDIFTIVQQEEGLSFQESIEWIKNFFNLTSESKFRFGRPKEIVHKQKEIKKKVIDLNEQLPIYNQSILNTFIDYQPIEFEREGISKEVMKMFEIKFDIDTESIIIPCRDYNNNLVGIRQRNLVERNIEIYGKYHPHIDYISNIVYKFPTSKILYGLNINKKRIIETKTIIIAEGEKSVLKSKTWFNEKDMTVASYGCSLSDYHIELIKSMGVEDVIFLYDREEDEKLIKKMEKIYKKCALYFNVFHINEYEDKIKVKDSPFDASLEDFKYLLENKLIEYKI